MSDFVYAESGERDGRRQGCLRLAGDLTVAEAAELRLALMAALEACEVLEIDASAVGEVDVAGLQALCAVHRGGVARQRQVRVKGLDAGPWPQVLRLAGFQRHEACPLSNDRKNCLWLC
ncbi:STAS domain-containing protein [Geoalkalibacter sp.]|uniref:STAS domain-containing protein n=1 Tax=Geoalkalibacter sp. TaxID=3041440 RepID=UPI00272EC59D|nr:STAS domain-containing protein [Geoalkalibacter sp.]